MPTRRQLANAIRALSMDAVQKANSGHPGMPMGMADIAEALWRHHLKHDPADPQWIDRDRFVAWGDSAGGHLASLLGTTGDEPGEGPPRESSRVQAVIDWYGRADLSRVWVLADAYEQLGYQMESTSLRNSFLQGTYELRSGMPTGTAPSTGSADVIRSMPTGFWLDFLGISMDPRKAEGMRFTINLVTPDNGEKYLIELSNATLTNIKGEQAPKPDLTITLNRADLNQVMMGASSFDDLIKAGKAKFEGDRKPFDQLRSLMVVFHPNFEMLPGTAPKAPSALPKPFEVPDLLPPDAAGD